MSAPRQPHIIIKCDMYVALFIFNFSLAMFVEAPSLLGYVNINCSFYKQTNKQTNKQTTRNQEKKRESSLPILIRLSFREIDFEDTKASAGFKNNRGHLTDRYGGKPFVFGKPLSFQIFDLVIMKNQYFNSLARGHVKTS